MLGQLLQFFQIGLLQRGATPVVDQQALGDGQEEGARLLQRGQFAAAKHADEGVLAEILGTLATTGGALQPGDQPFAMIAIQRADNFTVAGQHPCSPIPKRDEIDKR
ncbi:hypothetical protein D9M71_658080 [compost metagenome]